MNYELVSVCVKFEQRALLRIIQGLFVLFNNRLFAVVSGGVMFDVGVRRYSHLFVFSVQAALAFEYFEFIYPMACKCLHAANKESVTIAVGR